MTTMKVECAGCGEDCSHAYGTHYGLPYHFGCIPIRSKKHTAKGYEITDIVSAMKHESEWEN